MRYYSLIRVFRSCIFCSLSPFILRQDKSQKSKIGVAGRKEGRERDWVSSGSGFGNWA